MSNITTIQKCPDCAQPYDGVACICQAPWLFYTHLSETERLSMALYEDAAMRDTAMSSKVRAKEDAGRCASDLSASDEIRERAKMKVEQG